MNPKEKAMDYMIEQNKSAKDEQDYTQIDKKLSTCLDIALEEQAKEISSWLYVNRERNGYELFDMFQKFLKGVNKE